MLCRKVLHLLLPGVCLLTHAVVYACAIAGLFFDQRLQVTLTRMSKTEVELDVVGVDASVANAIRRVLLAEVCLHELLGGRATSPQTELLLTLALPQVPTVAVEHVYIWNNTSIIQDEVLSQRLGLVPLAIDPKKVEFKGCT